MKDDQKELADYVLKATSQYLANNSTLSNIGRTATAVTDLSKDLKKLTAEMEKSGRSSDRLSSSLNRLTGALVLLTAISAIIAGLNLYLEYLKYAAGQT